MRLTHASRILIVLALLAFCGTIVSRVFEQRLPVKLIDLKALGNFNFDLNTGTINDVPTIFRQLDGREVALDGYMWSPSAAKELTDFQFVYNIQNSWGQPPALQERVFLHVPNGKKLPYVDRYLRLVGTLHVNVRRENGVAASIFTLDVDHTESAPDGRPVQPVTWREYLANDRDITLEAMTFFLLLAAAIYLTATGARRLRREVRARRWRERGLCPAGGYDLRARDGCCPECGCGKHLHTIQHPA